MVLAATCNQFAAKCFVKTDKLTINGDCSQGVDKYLGIPYAQPPTGSLRFEPPKSLSNHSVITANKVGPACPNLRTMTDYQSEDCLYLNVYAPKGAKTGSKEKSVMVWIHGGSFDFGSGSEEQLDGSKLSEAEDMIVVTVNYRLGALGFFNGKNYAIADVVKAISWVHDNIEKFGGDSSSVALAGQSSGASLIYYLLNCEQLSGMFNRAIIQSPPAAIPAFSNKQEVEMSQKLAERLNCSDNMDIDCLRQVQIKDIVHQQDNWSELLNSVYNWGPTIDDKLVPKDIYAALSSGSLVNQVDIVIGTVKDESGPTLSSMIGGSMLGNISDSATSTMVTNMLTTVVPGSDQIFPKVWAKLDDVGNNILQMAVDFATSYMWQCPNWKFADTALDNNSVNKVYLYKVNLGIHNEHNDETASYCDPSKPEIVCHEDDIPLLFGNFANVTDSQVALSKEVQKRWAQFVKYGDPNGNSYKQWDAHTKDSLNLLILDAKSFVSQSQDAEKCANIDKKLVYPFELTQ